MLRLGTRRSLLALAQSGWVAREIERLNPGTQVELVEIETRGDRVLDTPLHAIEGKEFFVAELDDALRSGRVDLTVHSLKDLSLERPGEFVLAAVPAREDARDVVLYGPRAVARRAQLASQGPPRSDPSHAWTLRVGSGSPRRQHCLAALLSSEWELYGARVELCDLRGNVNTRLARLHEPEASERALDAVVLAAAGLHRLLADTTAAPTIRSLLRGVQWRWIGRLEAPSAPGQGALAIECLRARPEVLKLLKPLDDPRARAGVARERAVLATHGGGCHQRFGASTIEHEELGTMLRILGQDPSGRELDQLDWQRSLARSRRPSSGQIFDGTRWREAVFSTERLPLQQIENALAPLLQPVTTEQSPPSVVFVAHARAVDRELSELLAPLSHGAAPRITVFAAGAKSAQALRELGWVVSGHAEGLGLEWFYAQMGSLGAPVRWWILTHESAATRWNQKQKSTPGRPFTAVASYRQLATPRASRAALEETLATATHAFWGSGSQFDELKDQALQVIHHACGPGQTVDRLRAAQVEFEIFPSVEQWRKWIALN